MRHHIEILRRIESDALRASEATHKGLDYTIWCNTINLIRPREGWRADIQPSVVSKRQVIASHTGIEPCKYPRRAIFHHLQDRPASVPHVESALDVKGQTSRNAKLGGKSRDRTALVNPVDLALVATTDIQMAIRPKGQTRRIGNTREKRFDLSRARYTVQRDRHVLAFRPADGRINVPLRIHRRAGYRMQIVRKACRRRKGDRIALPLILDNLDALRPSTLWDYTEQQCRRHEYRAGRSRPKNDTACLQRLGI